MGTIAKANNLSSWLAHSAVTNGVLVYFILSLSINVCLTGLILWRLIRARSRARRNLGKSHGSVYSQVMMIVIESAAPYALITVVFVVLFGIRHPAFVLFFTLYPQLQVHLLFIFMRVVR